MSSGSLSWRWNLIRMSYDKFIMSSGWHALQLLSHPDDIRFHLMSSGWLNWCLYLIQVSYSEIHYHDLGHLDEYILNFHNTWWSFSASVLSSFPQPKYFRRLAIPIWLTLERAWNSRHGSVFTLSQSMAYSFGMFYVYGKDYWNHKRLHHYEIFHLSWLLCHSLKRYASISTCTGSWVNGNY